MKKAFLHYLWKFKKFDTLDLVSVHKEQISIIDLGSYLESENPIFFNAQLVINHQKWAGNVLMYPKSSDITVLENALDPSLQSTILYVVWLHDLASCTKENSEIPILELQTYVNPEIVSSYQLLMTPKSWIYCQKDLKNSSNWARTDWLEKLFLERLEQKTATIRALLATTRNDWEAVLFCLVAKNFGLNINGSLFYQIAQSIPFTILRKESNAPENLEALLFGFAGLLDSENQDGYFADLKFRYFYLLHKYQLEPPTLEPVQYAKLRPDNFPNIRLSQLANLYSNQHNLFSKIIELDTLEFAYTLFDVAVSPYWKTHYGFGKESSFKPKKISKSFVDLLVINTIIPFQFAYRSSLGQDASRESISLMRKISPEKNSVVTKFVAFGMTAADALDSQSLLQLKKEYCLKSKCLDCAIGVAVLQ
ncbi:hypothetical protein LPBF_03790 [Flavobacterium crassostreae]|uniref:DUF2851 domain-containing protein n=1 Tax=Flavobacterium crassostreae TaxID=1763534 RepID=A0A1B9E859_9FLAO|nr:DUF2851 family protein [Flavobacterium crassostreae]OCB78123.1 hypothetical protein LPBF_03790 [Flavobacterium crassostreae]